MTFTVPCLLLISALVNAAPHRDTEPLERDNFLMERNRMQEPLDREISLAKLLDEKTSFSRASLDYYLDILNDYKDYVPKEIQTIFAGLSERTKNEMVAAVNEIEDGRLKIPNNVPQIVAYVSKRTPELGENIDEAMDMLMRNLNKLSPTAKKGFNMWWGRVFEAVSAPPNMIANRLADLMADFYESYSRCDQTIKNEVRSIWPEAYNLLESDFARNFARAARKFADGGLSMDIHILSADAAYPPKAPKVKTENIERGYREQSGSMNRGPFGLGFNF
ncbi:unnamed protein product [Haemonchus placei]|uniref:Fatty-acid and retinol-binding protein 1 n=1 Tax=Haemonchus placei TaxID=6290 RepID=A0A0N4W0Q1_HAEPC|nr:unnamed protein product [Haemonchus placei]